MWCRACFQGRLTCSRELEGIDGIYAGWHHYASEGRRRLAKALTQFAASSELRPMTTKAQVRAFFIENRA